MVITLSLVGLLWFEGHKGGRQMRIGLQIMAGSRKEKASCRITPADRMNDTLRGISAPERPAFKGVTPRRNENTKVYITFDGVDRGSDIPFTGEKRTVTYRPFWTGGIPPSTKNGLQGQVFTNPPNVRG